MARTAGRPAGSIRVSLRSVPLAQWPSRLARRVTHERAQAQLVRDFAALSTGRALRAPGTSGPRIGFAVFGSGCWHLGIDSLLAHALAQRGAQPEFLICDMPALPLCAERTAHAHQTERCTGCVDDKRALLEATGLPWRGLTSFVAGGALARAQAVVEALDDDGVLAHVERGWPVGQWLHVSVGHFLRRDGRGADPEQVAARRRLMVNAIVSVEAVERWLDEVRPASVVALGGAYIMWRVVLELARARGIPVTCREMGKGGWDTQIFALNADAMSPDLDAAWAECRETPLLPAEQSAVDRFIDELPEKTYRASGTLDHAGADDLRARFGIPADAPLAVAFTNVTWDLATAGRDVAFEGVLDWIGETVRGIAGRPGVHLIIRAHPAEASVATRERILDQVRTDWPAGLDGVTLVPPDAVVAAADLCTAADVVLAYNSTAAIEAAVAGKPVLLCGRPHFRHRGFTIDIATRDEYHATLAAWAAGATITPPRLATELAGRYVHLFYLRYHLTMGWTTTPLEPPYQLTIRSLTELEPGRNEAVDEVCRGILEGRQILLPRMLTAREPAWTP